ncbi:hypothetical protein HAX54_028868 [Datura stramonium]|uniref:Uncharacterized protein n=1 Tax=Datura stramonium TaxID=4076 RepID=A0ABS8V4V2_DATST|nr:hypothetical protein [Datura stramonium]
MAFSVHGEPLRSVDFRCSDVSSTVDSSLTMVMGDDMVKSASESAAKHSRVDLLLEKNSLNIKALYLLQDIL